MLVTVDDQKVTAKTCGGRTSGVSGGTQGGERVDGREVGTACSVLNPEWRQRQ